MPSVPPIPVNLWGRIPPAAQAAVLALVQQYEQRLQALQQQVDDLRRRLNQNSTNSSRPPSSDPPHLNATTRTGPISTKPCRHTSTITRWQSGMRAWPTCSCMPSYETMKSNT